LMTHRILRIWSRQITTCSLDWKTIENLPFFFRSRGHCCLEILVGRIAVCFFLSSLLKLEQGAKKCLELHGGILNKSRVCSL
jgi:hypothetical protein